MGDKKSVTNVFRASGQKMLREALKDSRGDLLDEIPSYGSNRVPLETKISKEAGTRLDSAPDPQQINCERTSEDMIMDGVAVLKDGRKVTW